MIRPHASMAVLALVLGAHVGCSEDCDMDYFDWNVAVTVEEFPDADGVTVCVDGDCSPLDRVDSVDGTRFEGWIDLPDEEADVETTISDSSGLTLASFSERRTPVGDACYRNITLTADADGIRSTD